MTIKSLLFLLEPSDFSLQMINFVFNAILSQHFGFYFIFQMIGFSGLMKRVLEFGCFYIQKKSIIHKQGGCRSLCYSFIEQKENYFFPFAS